MSGFRKHLSALAAATAAALGAASTANAAPVSFDINPVSVVGAGSTFTATDVSGSSSALIQQTGTSAQVENGFLVFNQFSNNGVDVLNGTSRLVTTGNLGAGPTTYNLFATFQATVNGITGFGAGQTGTIAPGAFSFTLKADAGSTDTFAPGTTNALGGTAPTVTDNGTADIVLATGTSLGGSAGFQAGTGAPIFAVTSSFIVCDGTTGQGFLGNQLVVGGAASACGTFDARNFFVAPSPFFSLNFTSTTAGSAENLTVTSGALLPNATLNGITVDVNFAPEPGTIALLGAGLFLLGAWRLRRSRG
jgi:PEP-CTERM motif